jgi:hypothetical protein
LVRGRIGPRALIAALDRERAGGERVFVVLLRSQLASVELLDGARTRALERTVEQLERSGRLRTVLRNPDATVLELERE